MEEKRIIFYNKLRYLEDMDYLSYYLKYQLAPVILGYKPSVTVSLGKNKERSLSKLKTLEVIKLLGLQGIVLRETPRAHIVLAYRKCSIEAILGFSKGCSVLEQLDYPTHSAYAALAHLRKRYDSCHCPPELGIFLGFPVEDVKDFMFGTKKECLLCGYWQVFNNLSEAKRIFRSYDEAKESMLQELLEELLKVS